MQRGLFAQYTHVCTLMQAVVENAAVADVHRSAVESIADLA